MGVGQIIVAVCVLSVAVTLVAGQTKLCQAVNLVNLIAANWLGSAGLGLTWPGFGSTLCSAAHLLMANFNAQRDKYLCVFVCVWACLTNCLAKCAPAGASDCQVSRRA